MDPPGGSAGDPHSGDDECIAGEARCAGYMHQVCDSGRYVDVESCASACDADLGCVECVPDLGRTCVGDAAHECTASGTIGDRIETCGPGQCSNGACADDGCGDGSDLVYVVDTDDRLLSFDPRKLDLGQDPFTLIGTLGCPAGASWPDWGGPSAPFSMSVDRSATAWVLYTSGEIFHVNTDNASCEASGFTPGQLDFELFGMGFVSDAEGSSDETLWIAGGSVWDMQWGDTGDLGSIDDETLQVRRVGGLPGASHSPELTGTGNGELYGFYPGGSSSNSLVARIDKNTAGHHGGQTWSFSEPGGDARAWAFAHWGGKFYLFVTVEDFIWEDSQVLVLDPQTGSVTTALTDLPHVIVGAGVSTCAPVVIE